MKVVNSISELIGGTPMLRIQRGMTEILAKLEYLNPTGSSKDRAAAFMIEYAERNNLISGKVIIEPTSGNTGIALASIAAIKGYRIIIVMPETMSVERRNILKAYGAELVLTDGAKGMAGAIEKAKELQSQIPGSFIPSQFTNPANSAAHYATTGPELWQATAGKIDTFIAGVGTGGTLSGTGRFLKERNPDIEVIAIEPEESAVLSGEKAGAHKIQGIGAGFVPQIYDPSVCDRIIKIKGEDAIAAAKEFAKTYGAIVGISSGAAIKAAFDLADSGRYYCKTIAVVLPDSGDRYLSVLS